MPNITRHAYGCADTWKMLSCLHLISCVFIMCVNFFFIFGVNASTIVEAGERLIAVDVSCQLTMIILNLSHIVQLIVLPQTHS